MSHESFILVKIQEQANRIRFRQEQLIRIEVIKYEQKEDLANINYILFGAPDHISVDLTI